MCQPRSEVACDASIVIKRKAASRRTDVEMIKAFDKSVGGRLFAGLSTVLTLAVEEDKLPKLLSLIPKLGLV